MDKKRLLLEMADYDVWLTEMHRRSSVYGEFASKYIPQSFPCVLAWTQIDVPIDFLVFQFVYASDFGRKAVI
jgi:hypothetical protein